MMIFYINIYHHALLTTKTCNFRLRDSVIDSTADTLQKCDLTKGDCVTYSRNRRYALLRNQYISGKRRWGWGCMNHKHKHCYNECMTVLVYLWFYISQNCHCAKTKKISQCPPLSLMLLIRFTRSCKDGSGRFTKRDFCSRNTFIYPHADCDFTYVTIVRPIYHIGHHVGIITN